MIAPRVTVTPTTLELAEDTQSLSLSDAAAALLSSSGTYTVVLGNAPAADVTVTVTAPVADLTVTPASLTFTTDNWHTGQMVTVTAVEDGIAEIEESLALTHAVSGYGALTTAAEVMVTVFDVSPSTDATLSGLSLSDGGAGPGVRVGHHRLHRRCRECRRPRHGDAGAERGLCDAGISR